MRRTVSQRVSHPTADRRLTLRAALAMAIVLAVSTGCGAGDPAGNDGGGEPAADFAWPTGPRPTVTLHIERYGDIVLELYPELAPNTVANFVKLAGQGFYDDTKFHRVIPGFMIQGGDPLSRDDDAANDGLGDPGYKIADEHNPAPHDRGVLSMANQGRPDTGGSQFFIVHRDAHHLDGAHTVFGRVVDGLDVVDSIASVETDVHGRWGKPNRPVEHIVVAGTTVRSAGETASRASSTNTPPTG